MPDYSKSCIYKIYCKDENITDCYIGSTTNYKKRGYQHKENVNNYQSRKHKYKLYTFIREHGGWDNWNMTPIINYSCETKLEVAQHERFYIESLKATLNDKLPLQTREEWIAKNRPKINKYANDYYHKNKEKCLAAQKKWTIANKEQCKKIKAAYYQKNKQKLLQKKKDKYDFLKETTPSESV